jgi:DNA-binding NarL/FixJ family response regulator
LLKTIDIVEDNKICQQVLIKIINDSSDLLLGTVYETAEAAMEMIIETPDVAIVDVELPGINGIELIKIIKTKAPGILCMILSMHEDDDNIVKALENGADGYILKKSTHEQIEKAIKEVLNGDAPMSPYVAKRVISFFKKPAISDADRLLSEREQQVIELVATGMPYKQIAAKLFINHDTVKKHLKNIYNKLQVQNKVEALNKLNRR